MKSQVNDRKSFALTINYKKKLRQEISVYESSDEI